MLIIGDAHGLIDKYWKLMQKHKPDSSIQIGDWGFAKQHQWFLQNMDYSKHRLLFGNHDDTTYLHHPHSLGDYAQIPLSDNERMFTIRGAYSIDKAYRTEGKSWWKDEEMNYAQWQDCVDEYEQTRPDIVLSHDCPMVVKEHVFGYKDKTITNNGLQQCFQIHQPDIWIFGHYHMRKDVVIEGTRFICLEELGVFNIETDI